MISYYYMVNEIHVIFFDDKTGSIDRVLDSLRDFSAGISMMICSFNSGCKTEFEESTGKVYRYMDCPEIDENDLTTSLSSLRIVLSDYLNNASQLRFNLTCANSQLCFIAFTLSRYFDADMYALNGNGVTQSFDFSKTAPEQQLNSNCRMAIFSIGLSADGLRFDDIKIPTKFKRYLGRKGKRKTLDTLLKMELVRHESESHRGSSGRSYYRWKLTASGEEFFRTNKERLRSQYESLYNSE